MQHNMANVSKKMMVKSGVNDGIARHNKNMRSFDVQRLGQNQNVQ